MDWSNNTEACTISLFLEQIPFTLHSSSGRSNRRYARCLGVIFGLDPLSAHFIIAFGIRIVRALSDMGDCAVRMHGRESAENSGSQVHKHLTVRLPRRR